MNESFVESLPLGTTPPYARMHKWLQRGSVRLPYGVGHRRCIHVPFDGALVWLADVVAAGDLQ